MRKINELGFTTIELLACFIIVAAIVISMFSSIMNYRNKEQIAVIQNTIKTYQTSMVHLLEQSFIDNEVKKAEKTNENTLTITYKNDTVVTLTIETGANPKIIFDGITYPIPNVANLEAPSSVINVEDIGGVPFIIANLELVHPDIEKSYSIHISYPIMEITP